MSIKINDIDLNEKGISLNDLISTEVRDMQFDLIMNIYQKASKQVLQLLKGIQIEYNNIYNYNIINHTVSRIKSPESIIKKMQKKNLELNYKNLVENINDIAGVRIVCPMKDDIYKIVKIIEKITKWNIIKSKDYIKKPKKSGYSGYHMIVEVPITVVEGNESSKIFVKVEIQLRTMAMDFWATNEHKMKYKTNKKLRFIDSKRLALYAKILNILDDRFIKIGKRQNI